MGLSKLYSNLLCFMQKNTNLHDHVALGSQNINSCIKISLHDNTLMIVLHMVIYLRIGWLQVLFGSVLSSAHEERVEVGGKGRGWGRSFTKLLDHR